MEAFYVLSLSAIQIDYLQYSKRVSKPLADCTSRGLSVPDRKLSVILHFEPPPFQMHGKYSNLDLKYEFSAYQTLPGSFKTEFDFIDTLRVDRLMYFFIFLAVLRALEVSVNLTL